MSLGATDTSVSATVKARDRQCRRNTGELEVASTGKGKSYNPLLRISMEGPSGEGHVYVLEKDLLAAIEAASNGGCGER